MVHISSIPDLCLLLMFEKMNLGNLHHAGQVCRRWRALRQLAHKQRRSLDISLKCSLKEKQNFTFHFKYLRLKSLCADNAERIIAMFPNVRVLRIMQRDPEEADIGMENKSECIVRLAGLLATTTWSRLVSLKLDGFYFSDINDQPENPYHLLVQSINSLFALKHLVLENAICPSLLPSITILFQLKHLSISVNTTEFRQLVDTLVTFPNPKQLSGLKSFELFFDDQIEDYDDFRKLLQINSDIAQKITGLNFLSELHRGLFQRYCAHFPSIRDASFDYRFIGSWFPEQFKHLAKLRELQELLITLRAQDFPKYSYEKTNASLLKPKPIPSLKRLTVDLYELDSEAPLHQLPRDVFTCLSVSRTFPNITELCIKYVYDVVKCNVCSAHLALLSQAQFELCIHHLIEPFKQCKSLKKIEVQFRLAARVDSGSSGHMEARKKRICFVKRVTRAPFEMIDTE